MIPGGQRLAALALAMALPGAALALELELPFNSQLTTRVVTAPDSHALPVGAITPEGLPQRILEGQVERQAFRIPGQALTTLQLLEPLRAQLAGAGYEPIFECHAAGCGGFDFRFATEVLPAPDMYVDLTDFRFLAVHRGAGDHIGLLVSASANAGFIQMIRTTSGQASGVRTQLTAGGVATTEPAQPGVPQPDAPLSVIDSLKQRGHVALSDLTFDTGASSLAPGRFATLEALAAFLRADPTRRIALVGHTDAVGGLPGNITLSRQRATSVMSRLVSDYAVPAAQLEAEGMGYLSPVAPNTTPEGREANRRVEAVLLNTD